jgi:hypothetical protein
MRAWPARTIRDIGEHALIGGAVATGLALFHLFIEEWVAQGPSWNWLKPALAAGGIVFVGIALLEFILNGMKLRLESIGKVDGLWIDAIYDAEKRLTRGAIIEISSSKATGFIIKGTSYLYEREQAPKLEEVGTFDGKGWASSDNSLSYYFTGHEGILEAGQGLCHYIFSAYPASPGKLRLDGVFYSFVGNSVWYVVGRKITKKEMKEFRRDHVAALLERYLDGCAPIWREKH